MKLIAGTYLSDFTFEKSYDEAFTVFSCREMISNVFFTGRERDGRFVIEGNREGLVKAVNGERAVYKIEDYINEEYNQNILAG